MVSVRIVSDYNDSLWLHVPRTPLELFASADCLLDYMSAITILRLLPGCNRCYFSYATSEVSQTKIKVYEIQD